MGIELGLDQPESHVFRGRKNVKTNAEWADKDVRTIVYPLLHENDFIITRPKVYDVFTHEDDRISSGLLYLIAHTADPTNKLLTYIWKRPYDPKKSFEELYPCINIPKGLRTNSNIRTLRNTLKWTKKYNIHQLTFWATPLARKGFFTNASVFWLCTYEEIPFDFWVPHEKNGPGKGTDRIKFARQAFPLPFPSIGKDGIGLSNALNWYLDRQKRLFDNHNGRYTKHGYKTGTTKKSA